MRAYYYDNIPGDQRLPHDYIPSRPVSAETLDAINVKFWNIPVEGHESKIDAIAKERGYKNRDFINCSKEGLGEVSELFIERNILLQGVLICGFFIDDETNVFFFFFWFFFWNV